MIYLNLFLWCDVSLVLVMTYRSLIILVSYSSDHDILEFDLLVPFSSDHDIIIIGVWSFGVL